MGNIHIHHDDYDDKNIMVISRKPQSKKEIIEVNKYDDHLDTSEMLDFLKKHAHMLDPDMTAKRDDTNKKKKQKLTAVIAIAAIAAIAAWLLMNRDTDEQSLPPSQPTTAITTAKTAEGKPNVLRSDTTVNGVTLTMLTAVNAVPTLEIGNKCLDDTTAVLAVQAADVRGDNGQIAGACIVDGQVVSRGVRKAGFCAIVDGAITIGIAESTPLYEQAAESGGYFFRQYPLVAEGLVVENKPRGKSQRKALAEINGKIVVVMSQERLTFHDFSEALVEIGAKNAIYLVGSTAYGHYHIGNKTVPFGKRIEHPMSQTNYLVWR